MPTPSYEQIKTFQEIYKIFNDGLFSGQLPEVILNFSRSGAKTVAFYRPKTWISTNEKQTDLLAEISLSPKYLYRERRQIFSSVVHEQCHLWQDLFGKAPRSCYHDKQWADKMIECGLQPDNGHGGVTGQSVSHDVVNGGAFDRIFQTLDESLHLPFLTSKEEGMTMKRPSSRKKYTCPACQSSVWGKANLQIMCGDCNEHYNQEE